MTARVKTQSRIDARDYVRSRRTVQVDSTREARSLQRINERLARKYAGRRKAS